MKIKINFINRLGLQTIVAIAILYWVTYRSYLNEEPIFIAIGVLYLGQFVTELINFFRVWKIQKKES